MSSEEVSFIELQLRWEELRQLPDDHLAAISVLSFAASEINFLRKTYMSVSHPYVQNKTINSATNIGRFVVIRSWTSKLFECVTFFEKLSGPKPSTKDKILCKLACDSLKTFEPLKKSKGYEVARDLRNEATHHYSFSAACDNLKHVSSSGDFGFYTHEVGGNDYYPLGEEVMFHARLNRKWANVDSKTKRNALFMEWLDWNLSATDWLLKTHAHISNELAFKAIDSVKWKKKSYPVPVGFLGDASVARMPVFSVRETET